MLFKSQTQKILLYAIDSSSGLGKTGLTDLVCSVSKDGASNASATNTAAAVGNGLYSLELTAAETGAALVGVSATSATASVVVNPLIVFTTDGAVPPQEAGTSGGLGTVDASNRIAGIQGTINDLDGLNNFDPASDTVATVTTVTNMRGTDSALLASSAPSNFGDLAITSSTGKVTAGTVDDKTGYSLSGTITTLDGLNNFDPASDTVATVTTVTNMRGTDSALLASSAPSNFGDLAITSSTGKVTAGTVDDKTGYTVETIVSGTINAIADGLLDRADGVEPASAGTERTVREALRLILSACAGQVAGASGTTITIRDTNDTTNRITATVDSDGNRTAVTYIDS